MTIEELREQYREYERNRGNAPMFGDDYSEWLEQKIMQLIYFYCPHCGKEIEVLKGE